MNNRDEFQRAQAKTPQQQFLHTLEQEYHYPPRIAEAILVEAQQYLQGTPGGLQPGQMYVILARQGARNGQAVKDTDMVRVVWTVDDGVGDCQVQREHGSRALRQVRILRLLDEAVDQGAAASQEDLARVLQTSLRTVKRDCAELQTTGYSICPPEATWKGLDAGKPTRHRSSGFGWKGRRMIRLSCALDIVGHPFNATSRPLCKWSCCNSEV